MIIECVTKLEFFFQSNVGKGQLQNKKKSKSSNSLKMKLSPFLFISKILWNAMLMQKTVNTYCTHYCHTLPHPDNHQIVDMIVQLSFLFTKE